MIVLLEYLGRSGAPAPRHVTARSIRRPAAPA
jgi:hypothetical protein